MESHVTSGPQAPVWAGQLDGGGATVVAVVVVVGGLGGGGVVVVVVVVVVVAVVVVPVVVVVALVVVVVTGSPGQDVLTLISAQFQNLSGADLPAVSTADQSHSALLGSHPDGKS